jgi:resuscitation-promoting factor RpfE
MRRIAALASLLLLIGSVATASSDGSPDRPVKSIHLTAGPVERPDPRPPARAEHHRGPPLRAAQVHAATHQLTPLPAAHVDTIHHGAVDWDAIAECESGGNWAINTGNGYWGGLQFLPSTWFAWGGGPFDGVGPFPYSREEQIAVASGHSLSNWPYCQRYA